MFSRDHDSRTLLACAALLVSLSSAPVLAAGDPNVCDVPGERPDLAAGAINQVTRWGSLDGVTAYSFGTVDCNLGSCWVDWIYSTSHHPVIAQNLFRLADGKFEQVGQSWVKHVFFALSQTLCSPTCTPTDGSHLGVGCSDSNSASFNGYQPILGPKSEVNASTGVFVFPFTGTNQTGNITYKRLQVHDADLDPALNAGASYFMEAQYVAADDAAAANGANNASYRRVMVIGSNGVYPIALAAEATQVGQPAIHAWKAADPAVQESFVDISGDGRLFVAARATELGGGLWRYEYAVQNLNSHRSVRSFRVPLPFGANVGGVGFHDVDYHSGESYDPTDWADNDAQGLELEWSTATFAENPAANALRWGTLYNFRFVADVAPAAGAVTLGLFRPGSPEAVTIETLVPNACDADGICDPGESSCSCFADCGAPPAAEFCGNGADDDCDGRAECSDGDCCSDQACAGPDADGDGYQACDCDDANPLAWLPPGEVEQLVLSRVPGGTLLSWTAPLEWGAAAVSYDVLRSQNATNFMTSTLCLADADPQDTTLVDATAGPGPGGVQYYVVRAENACPAGQGPLGGGLGGVPRQGRSCP